MASTKNKENVASYPRPPLIEQTTKRLRVVLQDSSGSEQVLADSVSAYRICETSSPPTYYIPVKDVKMHLFKQNSKSTFCEVS